MLRICASILVATWLSPIGTASAAVLDCPMRDAPYSVDTPLIDIMLNPAARMAVDRTMPKLLGVMPARILKTDPPTSAAILTLRALVGFSRQPPEILSHADAALRDVAITPADKLARCARYDNDAVRLPARTGRPLLLVFEKITGFRDNPSVAAADAALRAIAVRNGWDIFITDKGGAMTTSTLAQVNAVVWNNVSGDALTLSERRAFRSYVERGGGFVGIHGSGGDPAYIWDWYADQLLGARFRGHPSEPQFQAARVVLDDSKAAIGRGLEPSWTMTDEWYSFWTNPRKAGAHILATLDESTYSPKERGEDISMGGDHPIAWTRCVGNGRSFYSAIGHRPEIYSEPHNVTLLSQAIVWAIGKGATRCRSGREIANGSGGR